ncbi:hypothetical protein C4J96_4585 [Pseudomonas orientalis]|nr:hypothetical protein C4J96_4585 [Pseudomonas orientalis]
MKLNGHDGKHCSYTSIVLKEIHSFSGDPCLRECSGSAVEADTQSAINQALLLQVDKVVEAFDLGISVQLIRRLASAWVEVSQFFQKLKLQLPIQLHMPGFRDRRFECDQNDITAWPGNYLRPG